MRPSIKSLQSHPTQASKLLPLLFENLDAETPISVLHIGPALSDTIEFFCDYRCKLHFVDLFAELPLIEEEDGPRLHQQVHDLLDFPADTQFDLCLFWDVFNYLSRDAVLALMAGLRDHLKQGSKAHMFAMHNTRTQTPSHVYGILDIDTLSCRERPKEPDYYDPHSQRKLKDMLYCFSMERSVLLPDSRLELVMNAKL